ncbi:MAG: hypothetical protein ACLGI9_06545, partial [Thermoanaerobaculia bacterium]
MAVLPLTREISWEGEEVPLSASSPLPLDSGREAWLVEEGTVEVFAVPAGSPGPRTHLCTIPAGGMVCGVEPDGGGHGLRLLAVGHAGTRLCRLPAPALRDLAHDPGRAANLAARLDAWLSALPGEIPRAAAPKVFAELRPGAEVRLDEAGRAIRTLEGVAWVRHASGASSFLGDERLALTDGEIVPLPEGLWLVSAGEVRLSALGTADLPWDEDLWRGLARFHRLALDLVAFQGERAERQERDRLGRKVDLDRSSLQGAYARLA